MIPELIQRLDLLAQKLNTTGEHLWQVLVRQAGVEALRSTLIVVACAAGTTAGTRLALSFYRKSAAAQEDGTEMACAMCCFACIAVSLIIAITGTMSLFDIPTELFNPEYWALRSILAALRGQ